MSGNPSPGAATPAIALSGGAAAATAHFSLTDGAIVTLDDTLVARLADTGAAVDISPGDRAEHSRDWWPLAMIWATQGEVAAIGAAVVRPDDAAQVAAVLAICNEARVPVTASGGRSGVCGSAVPVCGGVILDTTAMSGIVDVHTTSMILDVLPGTFGDALEDVLRADHGVTVGHWPQSMTLATVGGWLACRGAGQYSTRYGKIEDMVVGLDVVLADGSLIHTGGQPRQAVGPDLNQVFVGSEGTLGVITGARLQLHPTPAVEHRAAYAFDDFSAGLDACRRAIQRGATPAVLRLHDITEADRFGVQGRNLVIVLDEGDPAIVDAAMSVVDDECTRDGERLADGEDVVGAWVAHRNDVAALEASITKGYVVDTMEVAGPWGRLEAIHAAATEAIGGVEGTIVVSCHQSHAYVDGACLYFTFAAKVDAEKRDAYYVGAWEAGTRAVLGAGGALSHHHGIGINRARFVRDALGDGFDVFASIKTALDPNGILNPGKLGLRSAFGEPTWPGSAP
ncbi:MAG TPA: FAD-binding oxidoreductase [Acidimicrobiales bacterium]|nr:FAD-binding oxidoreductase [Acidimicrobiales bacterium]